MAETAETLAFTVYGQPLPKARPRIVGKRAYTPEKTKAWESQVAWVVRAAMGDIQPLTGDIGVSLVFHRVGKRRADLDNLTKAVLDALNGILYEDDKQVNKIEAAVQYKSNKPRVEIRLLTTSGSD